MKSSRHQHVKVLAAAGGSALIAIGTVAAVAAGHQQPGTITGSGMSTGQTATTTTPPSAPATSKAIPTMKAPRAKGF